MEKNKILYLITQTDPGGAQKYVDALASNIDDSKYVVEIAVGQGKKEKWLKKLDAQGYKVWQLNHLVRAVHPWHDFLSIFELYNLFDKTHPDIVHLNSSKAGTTAAVMAWVYKKVNSEKLKVIYTVHGFVFCEPLPILRKIFYIWAERIASLYRDKLICVSEQDKIVGLNYKIANHKKFITIHNGIDFNKIKFLEQETARKKLSDKYKLPPAKNWVGTIANLYATKNLEYLVRAAKIVLEKNQDLIFVVMGEGKTRSKLENEIKKLDLKNKFFLVGMVDNAPQYLPAFDMFALSSSKEGFPYTLLEAMAAGLPIVTTRVGGTLEIVEPDVNGLCVLPKKPKELARAIQDVLNNPDLQNKFRKNNLEKIKKFSLEKMIKETEKIYQS